MSARVSKIEKLRQKLKNNEPLPDLSELVEQFVDVAGGPRNVAKMLHDEWEKAASGGIVRMRIMQILTQVWKYASDTRPSVGDLGLVTEEDLEKLLQEKLARYGEVTTNG